MSMNLSRRDALYIIPLAIFTFLAALVHAHANIFFDIPIMRLAGHVRSPHATTLFKFVTDIGSLPGVTIIVLTLGFFILPRRKHYSRLMLVAGVAGAGILNLILKQLFGRVRPMYLTHLTVENGLSFPSGHSMISSALAVSLIFLSWNTRWRWPVFVAATIYAVAVGFSRVYLGVHYPSDVLGGWCVSILWVGFIAKWILPNSSQVTKRTAK